VADVEASAPVAVVSRHLGDDALASLEILSLHKLRKDRRRQQP
jgi:hypothetical protein